MRLTDKGIAALPAAAPGKRLEIWDDVVQGFGVRVTDTGHKSFVLYTRFRGVPSRRTLGEVGKIKLADARTDARWMLEAALRGEDPQADARDARANTFGAALETYITKHVRKQKRAKDTERELRNYLLAAWKDRPLGEIDKKDVIKLVERIANRGADRQAHNIFGLARTFFAWALETDRIKASPCAGIRPKKLIGEKRVRTACSTTPSSPRCGRRRRRRPIRLDLTTACCSSPAPARPRRAARHGLSSISMPAPGPYPRCASSQAFRIASRSRGPPWSSSRGLPRLGELVFTVDGKKPINGFSKSKARLDTPGRSNCRPRCRLADS